MSENAQAKIKFEIFQPCDFENFRKTTGASNSEELERTVEAF